ncbi:MAG: hypothetical protein GY857_08170 [Desulfobacula sp.]|nr:hypothetical protein [Desulfobacula sp.]
MEIIKKKAIIIISSTLLVAFAAASTFAWGPGGGMGPKMMESSSRYFTLR